MFTAWVILTTGRRPRRTHRMGIDGFTKCGIRTRFRVRFVREVDQWIFPHPRFCHVCFQYKYRFWSQRR